MMTRLVLIQDELNKNYRLVTGNSRIEVVLSKTVERKSAGFSKVIDVELPVVQSQPLKLGEVDAELKLMINCSDNNSERIIDQRQRQSLEMFITYGAQMIGSRIETLVSYIKVQTAIPGTSPFQINQMLVSIFPEIMSRIQELLLQATQEPNLPFLTIRIDNKLNLSAQVDKLIAQDQRDRMEIFKAIAMPELSTAYHPEEELEVRYEHYKKRNSAKVAMSRRGEGG